MRVRKVGKGEDEKVIITVKSGFSFVITKGNDNGIHIRSNDYNSRIDGYIHGIRDPKDKTAHNNISTLSLFGRSLK
jgi:hypothetical protein